MQAVATVTRSKFMNALELELIFRLSGIDAASRRAERERSVRAAGARNKIQAVLGRANSHALNPSPIGVAAMNVDL